MARAIEPILRPPDVLREETIVHTIDDLTYTVRYLLSRMHYNDQVQALQYLRHLDNGSDCPLNDKLRAAHRILAENI